MMDEMQIIPFENGVNGGIGSEMNEVILCEAAEEDFKPYVGQEFVSVDEAAKFYGIYAVANGFDIRRYTQHRWNDGSLMDKLIVCSREGKYISRKKKASMDNNGDKVGRNTHVRAIGCKARIRLQCKKGILKIDQFEEKHNHELVSVENREFQKLCSRLTDYHKSFIMSNIRLNIGATKTYRMLKEHLNGFENIGATLNHFKNFQRDIKCFIHDRDGQLFIDRFKSMEENSPGFFFDYDVDEEGCLRRAIWADGMGRRNYELFGDAVSFDPTYSTNKYSMVFTPFTGIDNHKKSVTFCGALIAKEDFESFNWVFSKFLAAVGGKEPSYIITDQDPSIIKSVKHIFRESRHRYCTWHIMNKVSVKYGATNNDYREFLAKLNSIIWDKEIEAAEFDIRWKEIMNEHGVGHGDWFEDCFSIRKQWVPSHCKDLRMGELMRTTQRSESSNSFFKRFEHKSGTLVEFWLRFESAIEQQRHNKKKLDNDDQHSAPTLITHLKIEENASKVYSHQIFKDFQEEMKFSVGNCRCKGYKEVNEEQVSSVEDADKGRTFDVYYHPGTLNVRCSCRLYERLGIICRHIIWIYTGHGVEEIPELVLQRRWMKDSVCKVGDSMKSLSWTGKTDGSQVEMTALWKEINETITFLQSGNLETVKLMCENLRKFREEHKSTNKKVTKEQEIEKLLGCKVSSEISIMPPKQSKNKGSGKRMLSTKSVAVGASNNAKRMCKNCKQKANHDKRNCPYPFVERASKTIDSGDE